MTLTIALTLGLALSSQAQAPAGGSAIPPVVSTPSQAQQPAQPADSKPAGTTGAKPAPPPAVTNPQPAPTAQMPQAISRSNEAIVLIERVEMLLNRKESDDGDLKSAGKVRLDRADLDEVLAELKQLKIMLQK